jgi:hypothetical protein
MPEMRDRQAPIRGYRPRGRTLVPVSPQPVPNRGALESQARRLLEQARERTGASVERMVKTFGERHAGAR